MLTGSTSIAIKHNEGVILSTDLILNYGRLKIPFKSRIYIINGTVFTFNGAIADIQEIIRIIEEENQKNTKTFLSSNDKSQSIMNPDNKETIEYTPYNKEKGLSSYMFTKFLQRVLYSRRTDMEPLKINITVAGKLTLQEKEILEENHYMKWQNIKDDYFLAHINERGLFYKSNVICTGLAQHLVTPFLRGNENEIEKILDFEDAKKKIEQSMLTLFYRNCSASDEIAVCFLEKNKITVKFEKLKSEWVE
ncbi:putative proteasome subunit beta type-7 [Cucumispora dikerogammari]|nr:putative proteasome subunit beta type-7 [Cucumispora dikerogammari]